METSTETLILKPMKMETKMATQMFNHMGMETAMEMLTTILT
jgi:hypothetical protein